MDRFSIGRFVVSRIEEWAGSFAPPAHLFPGFEAAAWDRHEREFVPDYYNPVDGKLHAYLQSWVIDTGELRILFDTGAGNDKERPGIPLFGNLQTDFLGRMAAAGYQPEDIDVVVCSHVHVDHVGWNTRLVEGRWLPTFPNARYLLPLGDRDYWDDQAPGDKPGEVGRLVNLGMFDDSVRPLMEMGRAEWVDDGFEVAPGLSLWSRPGHTPGSMAMHVHSDDERAMFVGDVVHHPMQIYQPDWNSAFCEDAEQARLTRRQVLNEAADMEALLIPAHFGGRHFVRVVREGTGFRPVFPT